MTPEAIRDALATPKDGITGSTPADLNPQFVASLMGVPKDWLTPSTSVETDSYRGLRKPADATHEYHITTCDGGRGGCFQPACGCPCHRRQQ